MAAWVEVRIVRLCVGLWGCEERMRGKEGREKREVEQSLNIDYIIWVLTIEVAVIIIILSFQVLVNSEAPDDLMENILSNHNALSGILMLSFLPPPTLFSVLSSPSSFLSFITLIPEVRMPIQCPGVLQTHSRIPRSLAVG